MSTQRRLWFRRLRGFSLLDAAAGIFLLVWVVLIFAAAYPTAHRSSRMSGSYSQAISAVQHKMDQLRAVGYGRLTASELEGASIIDPVTGPGPFHFESVDNLATDLWGAVGTITLTPAGANRMRVTIHVDWQQSPGGHRSTHEVQAIIANE